ncbi:5' exonuclease Apollo-like [Lineus longissimus]|uniref:5' exonuclease Apollo-like n=1 Tax=Lineus longissimus TaxID=88925 RepID=UPI002B4D6473
MNGLIIPDTPIAVDFWMIRHASQAKLFFLSHGHADHTAGLSPSWSQPIYCSDMTGRFIRNKFQIKEALIRTLEVNESHIIPLDVTSKETMTVSVIDANHCPGSVMFLFEGYFGNILYTGDFRYHPDMFVDSVLSQKQNIDILFLDNTYCDPRCVFPTQDAAIKEALDVIKFHPDHKVIIGTTDMGKEELLISIAKELQTIINVSNEKFDLYSILELPNVFTTDPTADDICVIARKKLTVPFLHDLTLDEMLPTIVLIPTCLFIGLGHSPYDNIENVFVIPFSDHSSYTELCTFVSKVKPKQIIPIVEYKKKVFGVNCSSRADMTCFDKYLDSVARSKVVVPKSVQLLMSSANTFNLKRPVLAKRARTESNAVKRRSKGARLGVLYCTPTKSEEKEGKKQAADVNEAPAVAENEKFTFLDFGPTLADDVIDSSCSEPQTDGAPSLMVPEAVSSPLETNFPSMHDEPSDQSCDFFSDLTTSQPCAENATSHISSDGNSGSVSLSQSNANLSRITIRKSARITKLSAAGEANSSSEETLSVNNGCTRRRMTNRDLCRILKLTIPPPVEKLGPTFTSRF